MWLDIAIRISLGSVKAFITAKVHSVFLQIALERGLKWLLLAPQAFLRMASKGGAAGRSLVASRFNGMARGDWGHVFRLWVRDREKMREKAERRQRSGRHEKEPIIEEEEERLTKRVMGLIGKAQVSKGVRGSPPMA